MAYAINSHFKRILYFLLAGNLKVKLWGALWCFWLFLSILAPFLLRFLYRYIADISRWAGHTCDCVSLSGGRLWCWHCLGVNESLTPNLLPRGFSVQCVESSSRSMRLRRGRVVLVHWWRLNWVLAYRKLERKNSMVIQSHVLGCMDMLWGNALFFSFAFQFHLHCIMSLYWRVWQLLCDL